MADFFCGMGNVARGYRQASRIEIAGAPTRRRGLPLRLQTAARGAARALHARTLTRTHTHTHTYTHTHKHTRTTSPRALAPQAGFAVLGGVDCDGSALKAFARNAQPNPAPPGGGRAEECEAFQCTVRRPGRSLFCKRGACARRCLPSWRGL
jgi:hypothetical protein